MATIVPPHRTSSIRAASSGAVPVWARIVVPEAPMRRLTVQGGYGGGAEWLKAHAWKACLRETVTWVRIPPPPLKSTTKLQAPQQGTDRTSASPPSPAVVPMRKPTPNVLAGLIAMHYSEPAARVGPRPPGGLASGVADMRSRRRWAGRRTSGVHGCTVSMRPNLDSKSGHSADALPIPPGPGQLGRRWRSNMKAYGLLAALVVLGLPTIGTPASAQIIPEELRQYYQERREEFRE